MQNPNTGPLAQPRPRPNRAPSLPALGGAGGRFRPPGSPVPRDPPVIIRIRLPRTLDGPFGRIARVQLEHHVARIIAILDAWDGDVEGEAEHEGCCAAGDDDPADSLPFCLASDHLPGKPDDAELLLGWTQSGDWGSGTADDDREQDTVDDESETDCDLSDDEPHFPHRDLLAHQIAYAGRLPDDVVSVRYADGATA